VALIGAGGMGEVYKGRDTRLNRTVAIKILPTHHGDDPDRRRRFEREAQAVAALAHPHICVLYDVGHHNGTDFLVMEYLQGETLATRLLKGPLPIEHVLRYAVEIADALDRAHRQGILHRDLKPGNLMLTKSGAKLLDFGLAKLRPPVLAGAMAAQTATDSLTAEGTLPGTLPYMAPEQLEGHDAGARTDIFAFGAIIHEMATGQRAFQADSSAKLIGAILKDTPPPISTIQPLTPPLLDRVVATCLAKDPDDRWQTARDLKRELKWVQETASQTAGAQRANTPSPRRKGPIIWTAAITCVVVAAVLIASVFARRTAVPSLATRFSVPAPENTTFPWSTGSQVALSPDGRILAFVAAKRDGPNTLWVRPLDATEARQLPGTEGAAAPFWSADSGSLVFSSWPGKLKKIPLSGGPPQIIADAREAASSGTSNRDGTIIFSAVDGLYRVSASGGRPTRITTLDDTQQERRHDSPWFLPDGRRFLYLITSEQREHAGIYCGSLDSPQKQLVLAEVSRAAYSQAGYLLFMRGRQLLAQRFNERSLELSGDPLPIAEPVGFLPGAGHAVFSISETGVLAYGQGGSNPNLAQLVWVDRTGKELNAVGSPGQYTDHTLSPDERQVAVARRDPETGTNDIWSIEIARGTMSRLTFDPANDRTPLWSPDGTRVVFASNRTGYFDLYQKSAKGESPDQLLLRATVARGSLSPADWSPDGRGLLFTSISRNENGDLSMDVWTLPLSPDAKPSPLVQTEFHEGQLQVSPDGRWVAYVSSEAGELAVYVRSFGSSARKYRISTGRGFFPKWRSDGRELFYLVDEPEGGDTAQTMALTVDGGDATFEAGVAKRLFKWRLGYSDHQVYSVTRDGRRFLINKHVGEPPVKPITVVLNWTEALKK
jgi:serine/threonine protein kinase/Tol biopolymer transport system component